MVVAVMTDGVRDGQSGQVRDFARGLRLVLVAGDVNAFRGYLGQWDDILGDTTELSGQSDADVRRTMMQLLRRPRQFGLPDWADDLEEAPEGSPEEVASHATPSGESDGSADIDYRELDSDATGNTPGGGRHPAVVECCRSPIENPRNRLKRRKPLVPPCRSSVVQSNRATAHQVPELRSRRCNWLMARSPMAMPRRRIRSTS